MKYNKLIILIISVVFIFSSSQIALAQGEVEKLKSKVSQMKKKKRQQMAQLANGKSKRKKRKNRRRKQSNQELQSAGAEGKTVHNQQEGKDAPYFIELSLLSDLLRSETSTKTEGGGESKGGSGAYLLSTEALWIMNSSFEIGGTLYFAESSQKSESETLTDREVVLGVKAKMNFGNLDEDLSLFYGYLQVGAGQGSVQASKDVESKESILQYGLGFGMHYFVDSNVAFTGELGVDIQNRKGEGYTTTRQDLHLAKIGLTLFL